MSMERKIRFLKASAWYKPFIKSVYTQEPDLKFCSYGIQYERLMGRRFGWSDFWKRHLETLGDFEVREVLLNIEPLQLRWAEEHNVRYNRANWAADILEAQIKLFQPEVVFFEDNATVTPAFRKTVKQRYPFVRLIVTWDGTMENPEVKSDAADVVLFPFKMGKELYANRGCAAYFFSHAFEPSILDELDPNEKKRRLTFVGSISERHTERKELLRKMLKCSELEIFAGNIPTGMDLWSAKQLNKLRRGDLVSFMDTARLSAHNNGGVFGVQMYQLLADSLVTLNSHLYPSILGAGNMRLFEAAGTGTCLLTDHIQGLERYYTPGEEVVTYRTPEEACEKADQLLRNPEMCKRIGARARARTLRDHTLSGRIRDFAEYLRQLL